jgi:hypothetical protein
MKRKSSEEEIFRQSDSFAWQQKGKQESDNNCMQQVQTSDCE